MLAVTVVIPDLIEVYCVARRVHQSWLKVGGGMRVKQLFDDVLAAWESLATFFLGTPLMVILDFKIFQNLFLDYEINKFICFG